jgi:multidrug efflux pump subunit AcrB
MGERRRGISSFSVLLLMAVIAVVGLACSSMLKLQYTPSASGSDIRVSYSYPGASARIVEAEVTSRLEGVLSGIRSCTGIRSTSSDGGGRITVSVGKGADLEAVRFEIASRIRNAYSSLPDGCSYPSISLNSRGEKSQTAIAYNVRSSLPSKEIAAFVEGRLLHPLSLVEGVSSVNFYGQTPYEWVFTFDSDLCSSLGISADQIRVAFNEYYADEIVGMSQSGGQSFGVRMRSDSAAPMAEIPVCKVEDRVVHLGDIATFRYQEALPSSYYRINGLNVLNLTVEVSSDANIVETVKAVKARLAELQDTIPDEIGISVSYDYSEYISEELEKILFRTALCLLILLLFAFAVNRSWRYMLLIAVTLAANMLISVALYYFIGLHVHIYTLAGVTVSLSIIIDNSILMIDHYSRYRDRAVFPDLICAVVTTVATLLVVLLLPEEEKANLTDFMLVIVINLLVSLLVSGLFVPALLDYLPMRSSPTLHRQRRLRRIARWNTVYVRYINWAQGHRWVLVLALVIAFGIPTCLLPTRFGDERRAPLKGYEKALNKLVEWKPYADNKKLIDKIFSTSFGLFYEAMSRSDFYREPVRPSLSISAGMPEGCTVQQLNEVMRSMENYLAHFEEIEVFETRISSARNGSITVNFKPEYEGTWLPSKIKSDVVAMATNFGGANWTVSGIDESFFNNNIVSDYKGHSIRLTGYNYDRLVEYGELLLGRLSANRRVSAPEIWGSGYGDRPTTEFNLKYDYEALNAFDISPYAYYSALRSPLYSSLIASLPEGREYADVRLVSSSGETFDLWRVNNLPIAVGEGRMKLSEVGSIAKEKSGLPIQRDNQAYTINVCFNFIGSYQLAEKLIESEVDHMNLEVLPVGFKAANGRGSRMFYDSKETYAGLILLVILIIYALCAIHFNSLRYPLVIILMIPVSFIGLFLAFGLSDFTFDKGGFAAFVMLCGITVNAGIYLVSAWRRSGEVKSAEAYVRSFDRKIWPISLTILSSVLGLIPFLFDGPSEVFWFAFAVGTIAGLLFSVLAVVFYLPAFLWRVPRRGKRR